MTDGTFGPYRLLSRLGTGGMGQVWRAVDTRKRREVALKLIRSDLEDRDFAARFHREAELAARLTSPYLVPIHDYGEIDGQIFLDMALIEGVDLGLLIQREGALEPGRAVTLVGQIARALGVAHRAGLVHRDVKPSNVLIADDDGDDHAYLIDFGLARRLEGTQLTQAGTLLGTLSYMAPERFRGPGDRRGDVYALACLLCEALTGQPPFVASTTPGIIYAHLRNPPPRVSERAGVPAALDDVVARGLAKDPADRFPDAGELAAAARAALALRGGGRAGRSRADDPADAPTARTPLAPPNQETTPPPRDTGITTPSRIVAVPGGAARDSAARPVDTGATTPVPRRPDATAGDARPDGPGADSPGHGSYVPNRAGTPSPTGGQRADRSGADAPGPDPQARSQAGTPSPTGGQRADRSGADAPGPDPHARSQAGTPSPTGGPRTERSSADAPGPGPHARSQAGAPSSGGGARPAGVDGTPHRATPPPEDPARADVTHRLPLPSVAVPAEPESGDVTHRMPFPAVGSPDTEDVTHRFPGRPTPLPREADPDLTHRYPGRPTAPPPPDPDVTHRFPNPPRETTSPGPGRPTPPPLPRVEPVLEKPRRRRTVAAVAVAVLIGAALIAWIWTGQQYYVGAAGDRVVVYQGVRGSVLGVPLSQVAEDTGIRTADLQQSDRVAVVGGITTTGGLDGAHAEVSRLRARLLPPCTTLGTAAPATATTVPGQNCRAG